MQMFTVVPGQGGRFQSVFPLTFPPVQCPPFLPSFSSFTDSSKQCCGIGGLHNSMFLRSTLLRGITFRFGDLLSATKQHLEMYASDIPLGEYGGGTVLVLWSKA